MRWMRKLDQRNRRQFALTLALSRRERGPHVRNLQKSSHGLLAAWAGEDFPACGNPFYSIFVPIRRGHKC